MAYTFEQVFAADPANPSNIAQNASITIFAPGDGTMTPIAITDPDGQPLANPIPVNANGFGSAFMADLDRVAWAGGGFTGFFTSYEGMKNEAVAARAAAETAASTAGAEAAVVADAAVATIIADADAAANSAASAAGSASASATAAANSAALVGAPADSAIAAAINGSATATKAALNATFIPKGTRRSAWSWGCGGSYSATPSPLRNVNPRHLLRLPVTTTRWRLKIANYDFMRSVAGGAGHMLRGIWIGEHLLNDGVGTGKFTAAAQVALADPNVAVPNDGTYYTSPWVTAPAAQITAGKQHIVSFEVTAAADVNTFKTNLTSFIHYGVGGGKGGQADPGAVVAGTSFFDTYVEYEYIDDGTHPVVLHIGDSITEGQSTSGASFPTTAWPAQYAELTGSASINMGCSGVQTNYWNLAAHKLWTKFDLASYAPDYAYVLLGTNDANASVTLADFKARAVQINDLLRGYGAKRIYWGLVPPRSGMTAGDAQDLLRKSYREWLQTNPNGIHGHADFDTVLRDPAATLQIRADWTVDGIHPTAPGYARMAKEAGSLRVTPRT